MHTPRSPTSRVLESQRDDFGRAHSVYHTTLAELKSENRTIK